MLSINFEDSRVVASDPFDLRPENGLQSLPDGSRRSGCSLAAERELSVFTEPNF